MRISDWSSDVCSSDLLTNLLGHAFKFTHAGAVRLKIARPDDGLPLLGTLPRAQTFALSVQHSGLGIPDEQLARLFQPFEPGDGTPCRRYVVLIRNRFV